MTAEWTPICHMLTTLAATQEAVGLWENYKLIAAVRGDFHLSLDATNALFESCLN